MALIIGKLKCYFCRKKEGLLHSVLDYGIYGELGKRTFYHSECLQMVEMEPEKFGHNWADKAIYINERLEANMKGCNRSLVEDFQKKVDKLHQLHFERMMPKKR